MADYTLSVKVTGDAKSYESALQGAEKSTSNFKKNLSGIGGKVSSVLSSGLKASATAIAGVAGALGTASVAAIKTGSDFEAQMSRVQAISGATGQEFEDLKNQAIQLGADTSFSASSAAQGMENLAAAGFTTQEIMDAMPGLLDLAAASGEDLGLSSDIAASALRGFGLEASEAGHVADVLAANANKTNSSVADTGEALKYIAPIANACGISMEETAAAIGIMANAGIQGSQAGTTLRGALSRLAKPTDPMIAKMEELGLSFFDANGKMKSLSEMVGMLRTSMEGLTDEQKQNALVTLFGQESLSGMMALINEGEGSLIGLTEEYKNCDGAAAQAATTMQDNLKGAVEQLGGSFETLGIVMYDSISSPLKNLAIEATDAVNQLTDAFRTGGMEGLIAAGTQILTDLLIGVANALPNVITTAAQVIQSLIDNLNANLPQILAAGADILTSLISGIASLIPSLASLGLNIITSLVSYIITNLPKIVEAGETLFADFTTAIKEKLPDLVESGGEMISNLLNGLIDSAPDIISQASDMMLDWLDAVWTAFPRVLEAGADIILNLFNGLVDNAPDIIAQAGEMLIDYIAEIGKHLPEILETGGKVIGKLLAGIIKAVPDLISEIPEIISKIQKKFSEVDWADIGEKIIEGIKGGISAIGSELADVLKSPINGIIGLVNGAISALNSLSVTIPDWVPGVGGSTFGVNLPTIPYLAHGTDNWAGGFAYMNEGGRGELTYLPDGAQVIPHDISVQYAKESARVNAAAEPLNLDGILNGMIIQVVNNTSVDGTPLKETVSDYTIRKIGNQQRAYGRSKGVAYA